MDLVNHLLFLDRVKFLPKQGFVDIKYNEISKADEINFRTFKTDTEEVNI